MILDPHSSVLVIFCKRPAYGTGKQRIAAALGKSAARECSELLLAATLEDAREWRGTVIISPADDGDSEWAAGLLPGAEVIPQPAGTLGERLRAVERHIRAGGGRKIIFIGTDSPALSAAVLNKAADSLQEHDAVFIPARDGGVTLMAASKPWPDLSRLPWETAKLGAALAAACRAEGFTIRLLPQSYDVDTVSDLQFAARDIAADARPGRRALYRWIERALPPAADISVVVPVLDDLAALEGLLTKLASMDGIRETVVVDAGSDQQCQQLCEHHHAIYLTAEACRGRQLRLGAERCGGDILWFLHADSRPATDATDRIHQHLAAGQDGGYFRFRFLGEHSVIKRLLEAGINLRTRVGIPYGDQGLFFRREAYFQTGGFAATPLFEEVGLVRELRQKFRFSEVDAEIGVSPRRWERDGWLRRSMHNRYLAIAFMLGTPADKLVQGYQHSNMSK